jgi:hypothetical protein
MKICPVGPEVFQADRKTDGQTYKNRRTNRQIEEETDMTKLLTLPNETKNDVPLEIWLPHVKYFRSSHFNLMKRRSITQSQGGEEYPTYSKTKDG